jgi:pimeloyl-ACP methyl ester carboxylesterase
MPNSSILGAALAALLLGAAPAQAAPQKRLPLPGEAFEVAGRAAFLIQPPEALRAAPQAWVLYAPTLRRYPGKEEEWLFQQLLDAGVAIAGVDVGDTYGAPAGRAVYSALCDHLAQERGLAASPSLLARSRGGVMLYPWASAHPHRVACVAGIYPVCDLRSYPGLTKAARAYGVTEEALERDLASHNPIDLLAPLAAARVPILHLHGDADRTVPLAENSLALKTRYEALGGEVTVEVAPGRGHDMWEGWFQSQQLVDFMVARSFRADTRGHLTPTLPGAPAGTTQLVGADASRLVPEDPSKPSRWTFRDGVLTASPQWDSVVTEDAYRDFRMHVEFATNAADDDNPEARGNSGVYIQQRYEVQILDSFGVAPEDYKASYCASLYRMRKPDVVACLPAGEWQTYDIAFRAARWRREEKVENARITVFHNGALVHDDVELPRKTGAGAKEGPEPRPIRLQGHHNEVQFRNVWIQPLDLDGVPASRRR